MAPRCHHHYCYQPGIGACLLSHQKDKSKTQNKKKGQFYAESSLCTSPIFQVFDHTQRKRGFLLELFLPGSIVGINRGSPNFKPGDRGWWMGVQRKLTADQSPVPVLTPFPTPPVIIYSSEVSRQLYVFCSGFLVVISGRDRMCFLLHLSRTGTTKFP